jgi:hypothetical protein
VTCSYTYLSLFTYKQIYLLVSTRTSALFLWFYITDYRLRNESLILRRDGIPFFAIMS